MLSVREAVQHWYSQGHSCLKCLLILINLPSIFQKRKKNSFVPLNANSHAFLRMVSENHIFSSSLTPPLEWNSTQTASSNSCGVVQYSDSCSPPIPQTLILVPHPKVTWTYPFLLFTLIIIWLRLCGRSWPVKWFLTGLENRFCPLLAPWLRLSCFPFSKSNWTFVSWALLILSQRCSMNGCCFPVWLTVEQIRKKMNIVSEGKEWAKVWTYWAWIDMTTRQTHYCLQSYLRLSWGWIPLEWYVRYLNLFYGECFNTSLLSSG